MWSTLFWLEYMSNNTQEEYYFQNISHTGKTGNAKMFEKAWEIQTTNVKLFMGTHNQYVVINNDIVKVYL